MAGGIVICVMGLLSSVTLVRSGALLLSLEELRHLYATEESRFIHVEGIEIHYQDRGVGPVMLLLHGSYGSLFTWDEVVAALDSNFRVIRTDAPGAGLSGPISDEAKDRGVRPEDVLEALLDALDVEQALVAGVSSGGVDAYRFASTRPERVAGLVLSNVPAGPLDNQGLPRSRRLERWTWLSERLGGFHPRGYWKAFFDWTFHAPARIDFRTVQLHYDMNRRPRDPNMPLRPWARSMAEVTPFLEGVSARTRLLWADSSPVLPLPAAQELLDSLPNAVADIRILEATGHYLQMEAAADYAGELRAFHRQLVAGADSPARPPP